MNEKVPNSFNTIFPSVEQIEWLNHPNSVHEYEYSRENNERNFESNNRFGVLEEFAEFDTLKQILRQYVQKCIPAYRRTESIWWIVSCLPKSTPNRLSAVSLNWMETFVIFHGDNKEHISAAFMIVSEHEFRKTYPDDSEFYEEYADTEIEISTYKAADHDQLRITMNSIYAIIAVLQNPAVLRASRELNLGLMRKGKTAYSKYHSYELADLLVEKQNN
jgi:hypothetical protein